MKKKQKVQLAILGVFVFCMVFSFALPKVFAEEEGFYDPNYSYDSSVDNPDQPSSSTPSVTPTQDETSSTGAVTEGQQSSTGAVTGGQQSSTGAVTTGNSGDPATFGNPIGYETVDGVLAQFLRAIQGIIAVLAVLMIVVGGIIYMTAAGDQSRIELAKKAVTSAVIGLALALAAPAFLQQIYSIMGADAPNSAPVANKSVSEIILSTLNVLLGIIGTLAIIMLVVGGIMYMTSGGDDGRAETAKNTIKYSIVGLIVAITSLIVVTQISNLF